MRFTIGRVSAGFMLLLVVGVLVFELFSYSWLQSSREREAADMMEDLAELTARRFRSEVRAAADISAMIEAGLFTNAGDCDRFVDRVRGLNDRYNVIAAGTLDGQITCSSPRANPLPSVADREWFTRLLERKDITVGSIQRSQTTGDYNMIIASPVKAPPNGDIDVVGVGLKMIWLSETLGKLALPKGAVVGLLEETGRVVARAPDPGDWLGKRVRAVPVADLLGAEGVTVAEVTAQDGVARLYAGVPVSVGGQRFLAFSGIQSNSIAAEADTLFLSMSGGVLVVGGALILLLSRFARRFVVRPLAAVEATARAIADGDFRSRVDVGSGVAEVRGLAGSINHMADNLRRDELVRRHAARLGSMGYWQLRPGDGAMIWSAELFDIFGVEPANLEPSIRTAGERVHPEDRAMFMARLSDACDGKAGYEFDFRIQRPDGAERHCRAKGEAADPEDGDGWVVGIVRDITERRELEARYQRAQRLEAVGQLTGGIAHDFNNMLTVFIGSSELLEQKLRDRPELRELAQHSLEAAEHAAQLTQHLLAFSRRQPLEPREVDVNALVLRMEDMLRRTLPEDIDVEISAPGDVEPSLVDPAQLESALLNLCLNARDAMPDGGRLTIDTSMVDLDAAYAAAQGELEPGRFVQIAVSDNGSGMSAELRDQAFEPFFTTKEVGKGTGMGLSMVYGFAKQSGGHVNIYSEPGEGTTVHLYLPVAERTSEPAPPALTAEGALGGTERVLVVEDNAAVREHVVLQLTSLGYGVAAAETGWEALDLLETEGEFSLILTDVVLKGDMNGAEFARQAQARRPGLPVLYMSGYTENAVVHHGRLDEDVAFIAKPFRRNELARKVRSVIENPRKGGD